MIFHWTDISLLLPQQKIAIIDLNTNENENDDDEQNIYNAEHLETANDSLSNFNNAHNFSHHEVDDMLDVDEWIQSICKDKMTDQVYKNEESGTLPLLLRGLSNGDCLTLKWQF